jgi:hypothetical protein
MVAAAQPKGHADHHCRQDGPRSRPSARPCARRSRPALHRSRAADALASSVGGAVGVWKLATLSKTTKPFPAERDIRGNMALPG